MVESLLRDSGGETLVRGRELVRGNYERGQCPGEFRREEWAGYR